MYAKIDVECKDGGVQGKVVGSPQEVIQLMTILIDDLANKTGTKFEDIIEIIEKSHKFDVIAKYGLDKIAKGEMTPKTATAFVNSMIDVIDKQNAKDKKE